MKNYCKDLQLIVKNQKCDLKGKIMKRYEIAQAQKDISDEKKKDMFRDMLTEMVHENYRDLASKINCYFQGTTHFKVELHRPSSK